MFDSHLHSSFSCDSQMDPEAACDKAIELGLDGIAFTDHLDLDYPGNSIGEIDFNKYMLYMNDLCKKYEGRLRVIKGIEVGIERHNVEKTKSIVEIHDFDFIISSIHVLNRNDLCKADFYQTMTKSEIYGDYLSEVLHSLNIYTDYDAIGHIGFIQRYCKYDDRTLRYADFSDIFDAIFKKVVTAGKGIEVNSTGYVFGLGAPIPDLDILTRYHELGGEIITTGSDAHKTVRISCDFDLTRDVLLKAGFKYTAYYKNRKPVFIKL